MTSPHPAPDRSGPVHVVWFRRDLRLHDHPALTDALAATANVVPLFVLDPTLLNGRFASPNRVSFLLGAVDALAAGFRERGLALRIRVGRPSDVVPRLAREVDATAVWVSRDATPYGRRRDRAVADALGADGRSFHARRGLLVHAPEQIAAASGHPYTVFTPFLRRWEARRMRDVLPAPERVRDGRWVADPTAPPDVPDPTRGGVRALPEVQALRLGPPTADPSGAPEPGEPAARERLERWLAAAPDGGPDGYAVRRDHLADEGGTSRLGADLRFGLISPVEVATRVLAAAGDAAGGRRYVSELAWRDFYAHMLWHRPDSAEAPFQRQYAGSRWPGGMLDDPETRPEADGPAEAWRRGRTGYPVVDAGMRQLAATGFMHNRARMIVASFLTKDLLIDWRVGEAHFMRHLLDGDPASNLGGWQWAASVGTDAQPWFRVFNPVTQGRRFDPDGTYVRRWVPELARVPADRIHDPWTMRPDEQADAACRIGRDYPAPIVDHAEARDRALGWFRSLRDGVASEG